MTREEKIYELAEKYDAFMPKQIYNILKDEPMSDAFLECVIIGMRQQYPSLFKFHIYEHRNQKTIQE